jgi:glyoxylase I family protein
LSAYSYFETPEEKPMLMDPNTPAWVQHLALEVADRETQLAIKDRLELAGVTVIGPKDGHLCVSIYFFDPSGHRLEIAYRKVTPNAATERDAYRILKRWMQTKRPDKDLVLEQPI